MIWAMVNNNCIEEIRESDEYPWDSHRFQIAVDITEMTPAPKVGWLWDRGTIFENIPDVSPRQIRQAMILIGQDPDNVLTMLDQLPDPIFKKLAKYEWEYSLTVQRRNPLVVQLGAAMGWTSDSLDALWKLAWSLK